MIHTRVILSIYRGMVISSKLIFWVEANPITMVSESTYGYDQVDLAEVACWTMQGDVGLHDGAGVS